MEEEVQDTSRAPQRIYNHAISIKANKRKDEEIVQELLQMGVDRSTAIQVTAEVSKQVTGANNKVAYRNILVGGIICLAGTILTIWSNYDAFGKGGYGAIYWGAILFGGVQFFRGLAQKI